MHSLSVFGTSSDAGKSTLSFALTYLLHKRGIKVAPFKAQNVSNNSQVTHSGGEIAIAQYFAADAIGLQTTPNMNPVLLKSGGASRAHVIVNGKNIGQKDVKSYYADLNKLKTPVKKAFKALLREYDVVVAEGAGSPVELNLMTKDLSNIYIAKKFNTKIVLVADIERGGVFASIYGVYKLLPKKLCKNVIGVIVNKFRGDISLFDDGVDIIEKKFKIPVLGVVPFKPFNLGFEDSQSLMNYVQEKAKTIINIGVIKLPHISNFNDFEPLVLDDELALSFISTPIEAQNCDMLMLPGSKRVVEDLLWLKDMGFETLLQDENRYIFAICGGYEMMFEHILDPYHVESERVLTKGFGRFKGAVTFDRKKTLKRGEYRLFKNVLKAFEIHNGIANKKAQKSKKLYGTFLHGVFESDALRFDLFSQVNPEYKGYCFERRKKESIEEFTSHIEKHVNIEAIELALCDK
jgi:adenosylcobyric acid synthase